MSRRMRLRGNGRAVWAVLVAASFLAALALVAQLGGAFESEPAVAPVTEATTTAGSTGARPVAPLSSSPKASGPSTTQARPRKRARSAAKKSSGPRTTNRPAQSAAPQVASPAAARGCRDTLVATARRDGVVARRLPSANAPAIAAFNRTNPLGAHQVFVVDRVVSHRGRIWYLVELPIRPNGSRGYVRADGVGLSKTKYGLTLDRRHYSLTLFVGCRPVRRFTVGIGAGSTPTPVGRFYLASLLKLPDPNTVYGPYAYGLSGFSDVLKTWRFGGIIGLHGTNDPSSIGRTISHGCIRMRNPDILGLVRILPLGTPILIV